MRRRADVTTQGRRDEPGGAPWLGPITDDEVVFDPALRTASELVATGSVPRVRPGPPAAATRTPGRVWRRAA